MTIHHAPADEAAGTAFAIADFLAKSELDRLDLFHRYLRSIIRRISPLLVELSLLEGLHLPEMVRLIGPPRDWPWRRLASPRPALLHSALGPRTSSTAGRRREVARFRRTFAEPGLVIRDADHPRGGFAVRPFRDTLGFTAALGPCTLTAVGSLAMLKLPDALPDTLALSLPGRRLGGFIDHPLFRDAAYRIVRIEAGSVDGRPVIVFRAPLVPIVLSPTAIRPADA